MASSFAEYEKELARSPDNPRVLYQLGDCLLETGKLEEAMGFLEKSSGDRSLECKFRLYEASVNCIWQAMAMPLVTELQRAIMRANQHFQVGSRSRENG